MRFVKDAIGVFCLLAALLLGVVWVRSYWVGEQVRHTWWADEGEPMVYYQQGWQSDRGQLSWYRAGLEWKTTAPFNIDRDQLGQLMPESSLAYHRSVTAWSASGAPWHGFEYEKRDEKGPGTGFAQWLRRVAVPTWLPLLIFAAPVGLWLRGVLRRRGAHECPNCGYDLRATPDRCPECGLAAG